MHRDRGLQRDNRALAAGQNPFDARAVPIAQLRQYLLGHVDGTRKTHATMREGALRLPEQGARRCVVHVDVELVWEHEFDASQCVVGSGLLTQARREIAGRIAPPVDRRQGDRLVTLHCFVTLACQRLRARAQLFEHLVDGNRVWHVPVGVDLHVFHLIGEHGRLVVGGSDDDAHQLDPAAVLDAAQLEGGDVDLDIVLAEVLRHPAPALHGHDDLTQALSDGNVELQIRALADDAVSIKPVARLETLDRGDEVFGVCLLRTGGRLGGCAIGDGKAPAQGGDDVCFHAGLEQVADGDLGPATGRFNGAILLQRLLQAEVVGDLGLPGVEKLFNVAQGRQQTQGGHHVDRLGLPVEFRLDLGRQEPSHFQV